ncbi:MAG: 1-acyl-sn-glycerol-3-phosphate acyltransferase [Sphingobium sp.]|nr:1-acyl-sn-glycerol-3-phosphate acyltransferase [Sphingobium sp.]
MGKLRRAKRIAALFLCLGLCLPPHLFCRLLSLPSHWPRRFLALAARSLGVRVRTSCIPRKQDIFFVANHLSWLDILALGGATGTAFIAKDDMEKWPVVGWLSKLNDTIFVSRANRADVREQIKTLRAALEKHKPLALFPEGTTGDGEHILPFKPALLAGLMPPPRALDIQPVYIDYGSALDDVRWPEEEGFAANAARIIGRKGHLCVTLHFLPPFDPEDYADRKAIAEEARNRILAWQSASLDRPSPV